MGACAISLRNARLVQPQVLRRYFDGEYPDGGCQKALQFSAFQQPPGAGLSVVGDGASKSGSSLAVVNTIGHTDWLIGERD